MPKLSSATPRWAKLTRRWPEGGSSSVMLGLPWNSSAITAVLRQLLEIRERMEQAGLSLSEAAELQAAAEACAADADAFSANGEANRPEEAMAVALQRLRAAELVSWPWPAIAQSEPQQLLKAVEVPLHPATLQALRHA